MKKLLDRIKELTDLHGNVGYEDHVIQYLCRELEAFSDQITVDSIGNTTVHLTPYLNGQPKVMLFAHMDEVGMMVRRIGKDGYIYVEKLGSLNPTTLQGARVELHGRQGSMYGVIGTKSHHYLQPSDKVNRIALTDLYIDIGAVSFDDAKSMGVDVGTPITYQRNFLELGNHRVSNKCMDNRALVAILVELIQRIDIYQLKLDTYVVFSVQEEFNTRGIMPTVREIDPNIAIGLDITPACDTPDLSNYLDISLGKGPALTYMNHHSRGTLAGLVSNQGFLNYIEQVALDNDIALQKEVATGILTETAYISIERTKTTVMNIGLPTRYTHSPIETIDMEDALHLLSLLEHLLYSFSEELEFGKHIDIQRKE